MKATYNRMQELMNKIGQDFAILCGDVVGPSNATWQDVAGTAEANVFALAKQLEKARKGECESGLVFPSPTEFLPSENWQCPTCKDVVEVDREDYPEIGTPYCADCDCERELL